MKNYIFGIDQTDPVGAARRFKELGLGALVLTRPSEMILAATDESGLDVYLCFGAHSLGEEFQDSYYWAQDYQGRPQQWFGSGCPNDPAIQKHRLDQAAALAAATPGLKGVLVDGARFASPSSAVTMDAFLSCFCPRCAKKATELGLDFARMQSSVRSLADFFRSGSPAVLNQLAGLDDWLMFRALSCQAYFELYTSRIKQAGSNLVAGAFIFAASLADLVGQTTSATAGLDLVCPMLYRHYEPAGQAAACLNHEWADLLLALSGRSGLTPEKSLGYLSRWGGFEPALLAGSLEADSIRQDGFLPGQLEKETASLVRQNKAAQIAPVIQLADPRLAESIAAVQAGGAQSFGLFAYREDLLHYLARARA